MSGRPKARIIKVGTVDAEGVVSGFHFDCMGIVPGFAIEEEGVYYCGYSVDELKRIAADHTPEEEK